MSVIPIALQLLPLIPSLVENVIKIIRVVKADPATSTEVQAQMEALDKRLSEIVEQVRQAPLPV